VPPGFRVEVVAEGFALPSAVAVGPGGAFGFDLYIGDWINSTVERLSVSASTRTVIAAGITNPGALAFGPPGLFPSGLYTINADGDVIIIDAMGGQQVLARVPTPFGRDMAFDTSGDFGGDLYVMDTAGGLPPFGDKILRVSPTGTASLFTMAPRMPEENAWGIAFGLGRFGTDLYVSFGGSALIGSPIPSIYRINRTGDGSAFAVYPEFHELMDIAFSPGGSFGEYLYVGELTNNTIYRLTPAGDLEAFARGFNFGSQISADLAFGRDGSLYVAEGGMGRLLRIVVPGQGSSTGVLLVFLGIIAVAAVAPLAFVLIRARRKK